MTPEEIEEINKTKPYVGAMEEQLLEQGNEVAPDATEEEVVAQYNTEILEEDAPEGYELVKGESFDDWDKEKGRNILKTVFGGIAGAFGARKAIAEDKARAGQPLNKADEAVLKLRAVEDNIVKEKKRDAFGDVAKKLLPVAAVAIIAYLVFKK